MSTNMNIIGQTTIMLPIASALMNLSTGVAPGGLFTIASALSVTLSTHFLKGEYSMKSGSGVLSFVSELDVRAKVLLYPGDASAKLLPRKYWIIFSSLVVAFGNDGSNLDGHAGVTWHQ
ncbi:hypothetical protein FRC14_000408, partial [Serendipita sp. 396]